MDKNVRAIIVLFLGIYVALYVSFGAIPGNPPWLLRVCAILEIGFTYWVLFSKKNNLYADGIIEPEEGISTRMQKINFLRAAPSILTSFGLACTFIAILIGVAGIEVVDGDIVGLDLFISSLAGKFLTSIVALLGAVLIDWWTPALLQDQEKETEQGIKNELAEIKESLKQKELSNQIAQGIKKGLQVEAIDNLLKSIKDGAGAMSAAATNIGDQVNALNDLLGQEEFKKSISSITEMTKNLDNFFMNIEKNKKVKDFSNNMQAAAVNVYALSEQLTTLKNAWDQNNLAGKLVDIAGKLNTQTTQLTAHQNDFAQQLKAHESSFHGNIQQTLVSLQGEIEKNVNAMQGEAGQITGALTNALNGLHEIINNTLDQSVRNAAAQAAEQMVNTIKEKMEEQTAAFKQAVKEVQADLSKIVNQQPVSQSVAVNATNNDNVGGIANTLERPVQQSISEMKQSFDELKNSMNDLSKKLADVSPKDTSATNSVNEKDWAAIKSALTSLQSLPKNITTLGAAIDTLKQELQQMSTKQVFVLESKPTSGQVRQTVASHSTTQVKQPQTKQPPMGQEQEQIQTNVKAGSQVESLSKLPQQRKQAAVEKKGEEKGIDESLTGKTNVGEKQLTKDKSREETKEGIIEEKSASEPKLEEEKGWVMSVKRFFKKNK